LSPSSAERERRSIRRAEGGRGSVRMQVRRGAQRPPGGEREGTADAGRRGGPGGWRLFAGDAVAVAVELGPVAGLADVDRGHARGAGGRAVGVEHLTVRPGGRGGRRREG